MVKVYVDTNVIVADTSKHHMHHANAAALFQTVQQRKWTPVISGHGLAEVNAVLTAAPHKPRPTLAAIEEMFAENILSLFEVESLARTDYVKIIKECAALGWTGGRIATLSTSMRRARQDAAAFTPTTSTFSPDCARSARPHHGPVRLATPPS